MNHAMPKHERDWLIALSTPGLCEAVSFADRALVSVRGRRFIVPPIGWAINTTRPWELTEAGIIALGKKP